MSSTIQRNRVAMLRQLVERHSIDLAADHSATDELATYLRGEQPCAAIAVVTRGGEQRNGLPWTCIEPSHDTIECALSAVAAFCESEIYAELPVEIVYLDSGRVIVPDYPRLPWRVGDAYRLPRPVISKEA